MRKIVIGSRGSQLALRQSKILQEALQKHHPDLESSIEVIRTTGDQTPQADLSKLATSVKGLFVKEIEEALLEHQIDLAGPQSQGSSHGNAGGIDPGGHFTQGGSTRRTGDGLP